MKKTILLMVGIFLILIAGCVTFLLCFGGIICTDANVNELSWEELWLRENGPWVLRDLSPEELIGESIVLGAIENEEMAREKTIMVWQEHGRPRDYERSILEVRHHVPQDIWFVAIHPPEGSIGTILGIFIRGSDGKVLVMWGM